MKYSNCLDVMPVAKGLFFALVDGKAVEFQPYQLLTLFWRLNKSNFKTGFVQSNCLQQAFIPEVFDYRIYRLGPVHCIEMESRNTVLE